MTTQEYVGEREDTPVYLCNNGRYSSAWFFDSTGDWGGGHKDRLFIQSDGSWTGGTLSARFFRSKEEALEWITPLLDKQFDPKIRKSVPLF
jgi:hypothetical protein